MSILFINQFLLMKTDVVLFLVAAPTRKTHVLHSLFVPGARVLSPLSLFTRPAERPFAVRFSRSPEARAKTAVTPNV